MRRPNKVPPHRNGQPAPDQQQKAHDQKQVASQPEFFGIGRKDEVGGALGNELQVGLRARHEALAREPARANRDHALMM